MFQNQMQNPFLMIQKFNEFQRSFSGNAQEEVMKLVQSGKISQAQLNQLQGMATQFQAIMRQINR